MDAYVTIGTFMFTLAVVNAGLAEQKGRSRLAWFISSLLLGPLATCCIVIWPRPEPVAARKQRDQASPAHPARDVRA